MSPKPDLKTGPRNSGCATQPIPLTSLKTGEQGRVLSFEGGHGFQRQMSDLGLQPGCLIEVLGGKGRGPVLVAAGALRIALGRGMAEKILVACDVRRRASGCPA